jgi:hypothetical protein
MSCRREQAAAHVSQAAGNSVLRNLAVGALNTAGRTKIKSSLRWVSRDPTRALDILGQPA